MTDLPKPLIAPNVNLHDFKYMPLYVGRLRDSGFASTVTDAGFRAGVLLWCASWHQVPAGSLPDIDASLANMAGFGRFVKEWAKVKKEAMYGWILCDDGRWYHPVICEVAKESWESLHKYEFRKFAERLRKSNDTRAKKHQPLVVIPTFDVWMEAGRPYEWLETSSNLPPEGAKVPVEEGDFSEGSAPEIHDIKEGKDKSNVKEHKGNITEGKKRESKAKPAANAPGKAVGRGGTHSLESAARFDEFWSAYPKKQSKLPASKAFEKIDFKNHTFEKIMEALEVFKKSEQWGRDGGQYIPLASTWINQQRWNDDLAALIPANPQATQQPAPRPAYRPQQRGDSPVPPDQQSDEFIYDSEGYPVAMKPANSGGLAALDTGMLQRLGGSNG